MSTYFMIWLAVSSTMVVGCGTNGNNPQQEIADKSAKQTPLSPDQIKALSEKERAMHKPGFHENR